MTTEQPNGIHHVNFVVRRLDDHLPQLERQLGVQAIVEPLDERGAVTARLPLGDSWLVLVEPTRMDGVPGRFLNRHGEGFFLLSVGVGSLDRALARLAPDVVRRRGVDGWQIADLRAPLPGGGVLQLTETGGVANARRRGDRQENP